MDTRLVEYFVTVAEELSVTRASERLYAAQSTVSAGLRSLERELGVPLLTRSTRSVALTPEGAALLPTAKALLDEAERLRTLASESGAGLRGRLTFGIFTAIEVVDLPAALGRFRRSYPLVDVHMVASATGTTGLIEDLRQGRVDLAFAALPTPPGMQSWELATVPFVALVPPDDSLAGRSECTLAELSERPWVDVLPGFGNRVQLERLLAEHGLGRRVAAEVADLPSVPRFVANGIGVAVIPDFVDTTGCARLRVSDVQETWTLRLLARPDGLRRPHLAALVEALTQEANDASRDA